MHIYKKTREKADERFQSVYAEAVGLTYKILTWRNNHVFVDSR